MARNKPQRPFDGNGKLSTRFSLDFQTKMLAIAARIPYFLDLYGEIFQPGMFDTDYHRDVCSWIGSYYSQYHAQPGRSTLLRIMRQHLPDGGPLLDGYKTLINRVYAVDLTESKYITDQLVTAARYQSVKGALYQMTDMLDSGRFDEMSRVLDAALKTGSGTGDLGLELTRDMESAVLRFGMLEEPLKVGFKGLERAVGNFYSGEETVIVSAPNKGKSTLLGNLAYGAARNDLTVFYYTLEIGAERMLCRFYSRMAMKETKVLSNNIDLLRHSIHRFRMSTKGSLWVKFFPPRSITIDGLRSHISMARGLDIKPNLIIVDYADLLRSNNKMAPRHEQLREIYEDLRALANEFDVHVLTGSQSTRQTLYADVIDLDDLSESWGKAATADSVIAICQGWEEQQAKVLRLYVAKARNETRGSFVNCIADFSHLVVRETALETYVKTMRRSGFRVDDQGRLITRQRRSHQLTSAQRNGMREHYD